MKSFYFEGFEEKFKTRAASKSEISSTVAFCINHGILNETYFYFA